MIFLTKTLVFKRYSDTVGIFKNNSVFLIISGIFVFGLLIGSFSISVCENNDFYGLSGYFSDYINFLKGCGYSDIFFSSLFMFSLLILINYILGLCVVGNFINLFIFLFFSFGVGCISGFLYKSFSINGIGFFALALLPGLFLFCINYILSLKRSFCFSKELFKLCKKGSNIAIDFKSYSLKFLVHFILVIINSLVYSFFTNTFVTMFEFT